MLTFTWFKFSELTTQQLYDILALRFEVFVIEQRCFYLDPDGKDQSALHLMGMENNTLVTYARLFPPTESEPKLIFGRVAAANSVRGKGYGKLLMQEIIDYCEKHYPDSSIKCSAQHYLKRFYESFNFVAHGEVYDDAGIPHIEMMRS